MGTANEFGVVGLGRMGGGLALHAREVGFRVVGLDVRGLRAGLLAASVEEVRTMDALRARSRHRARCSSTSPRDLQSTRCSTRSCRCSTRATSWWTVGTRTGGTRSVGTRLAARGIALVDLGTSGGVEGARRGVLHGGRRARGCRPRRADP